MKKKILLGLCALSFVATMNASIIAEPVAGTKKIQLTEQKISAKRGQLVYQVIDNEVVLKNNVITNIVFSDKVTVAYRNRTSKSLKPRYEISFYNAYGLLLGSDKVGSSLGLFGGSTYMKPNELSSEKLLFDWLPIAKVFEQSNIELPDDYKVVKWVVISNSNTALKKQVLPFEARIVLSRNGRLKLNGKRTQLSDLISTLKKANVALTEKVRITVSQEAQVNQVVSLIDTLKKAGYSKIMSGNVNN